MPAIRQIKYVLVNDAVSGSSCIASTMKLYEISINDVISMHTKVM